MPVNDDFETIHYNRYMAYREESGDERYALSVTAVGTTSPSPWFDIENPIECERPKQRKILFTEKM